MGFNLDNYEPVKDRITHFYKDHPDGRIITDLISTPETLDKCAAFRASVYLGDILKATGFAYEAQGQGVNKDAWVENSETSAIGRALANMDYCGTMRPSREEMGKVGHPAPQRAPEDPRIELIKGNLESLALEGIERDALKKELWHDYAGDLDKILEDLELRVLKATRISGRKSA